MSNLPYPIAPQTEFPNQNRRDENNGQQQQQPYPPQQQQSPYPPVAAAAAAPYPTAAAAAPYPPQNTMSYDPYNNPYPPQQPQQGMYPSIPDPNAPTGYPAQGPPAYPNAYPAMPSGSPSAYPDPSAYPQVPSAYPQVPNAYPQAGGYPTSSPVAAPYRDPPVVGAAAAPYPNTPYSLLPGPGPSAVYPTPPSPTSASASPIPSAPSAPPAPSAPTYNPEYQEDTNLNNGKFSGKGLPKGFGKALSKGFQMAEGALQKTDLGRNLPSNLQDFFNNPSSGGGGGGGSSMSGDNTRNIPINIIDEPYNPQQPYMPQDPQPYMPAQPYMPPNPEPMAAPSFSSSIKKFKGQDYDQIKAECCSRGALFKDPEFKAGSHLLVEGESEFVIPYFRGTRFEANSIEWLRPKEICRNPELFVGGSDRFDINQGEIGNCWFLAAMANLVENKKLFQRVVPKDQGGFNDHAYCGIFKFRFWRFGEWVEICVDDRLPTRGGKLIYLRSVQANEFWGALLEKAYAKLHGSYKALEGGLTIEAAVDFSGGIPEMIDLHKSKMTPERIFYLMSKADARGAFLGCALSPHHASEAKRLGLQARHAYTITKVVDVRGRNGARGSIPLVRVRNPHGNSREWKGDWSDGDRNWQAIPKDLRRDLGLTFDDDGEFYMHFRDFLGYFGELELCHLNPDSVEGGSHKKFEVFHFNGEWRRGRSSGGCGNDGTRSYSINPQFFITLSDPDPYDDVTSCPVIISLAQRQGKRKCEHAIGFRIYKCDLSARKLDEVFIKRNNSIDRTDSFINLREVSKRLLLGQGRYCIIPSTFQAGEEGEFLLRVFVERSWGSSDKGRGQQVRDTMDSGEDLSNQFQNIRFDDGRDNTGSGYADPFDGPGAAGGSGRGQSQSNKFIGMAMKTLEDNFPKQAKGLSKLTDFYGWSSNKDQEYDLLKNISSNHPPPGQHPHASFHQQQHQQHMNAFMPTNQQHSFQQFPPY